VEKIFGKDMFLAVAAICVGDWGTSAVGARIEAPKKAPRGVRCGEGYTPSPLEEGSGDGAGDCVCSPENFSIFELKKASFGAFWVLLFQLN